MKLNVKKASVDVTLYVFIQDSTSTTGGGKTGLLFNAASLVCYYVRPLGSATALTLATQTVTGAHSDGGFVEVDATNMPGTYRLDLSDAIVATGVNSVVVMLKGATGMAPLVLELALLAVDHQDAVRFGMTSLPNAAAEAAGGLFTRGSGAGQLNQQANGQLDANVARWLNTAAATPATAGVPKVAIEAAGDLAQAAADKAWATAARTLTAATNITSTGGTTVPQTGDSFARLGAPAGASVSADILVIDNFVDDIESRVGTPSDLGSGATVAANLVDIEGQTDDIGVAGAGLTSAGITAAGIRAAIGLAAANIDTQLAALLALIDTEVAAILAAVDTEVAAIKAKTDNLPTDPADESSIQGTLTTISAFLDTEIAAILAAVDTEIAAIKAKTDNLPSVIKKNTELVAFEFLMVDATDFATPETGVVITATRSIDGGSFSACTNSAAEVAGGIYKITLSAADTNGTVITYKFAGTGCADRFVTVVTNA